MKMLKVALGVSSLAVLLAACNDNTSETTAEKESSTGKSTAVHTKKNNDNTAVKEASPNTLQTKASTIQKAVDSKKADRDYILNVMAGYQYIQIGDNQYIYYGINQEQNVFYMMEVNFDASGDYVQNINVVDNASEEQIALLQNQIKEQQQQLSDLEQQKMEKELDDYYAQLEQERQKEEEAQAQAKADAEAEAQAEEEKKEQEEAEAQAQAKADNDVQAEADVLAEQEEPSEDPQWEDSQAIAEQGLEEQSVSEEQAVQLVRQKLAIPDSSDTIVELDHIDSDGKYVVHAYNVVIDDEATGEGHNATVAWYTVDPIDGTMVDQFADLQ
ncbi:hypothetical protein [Priestia megaterium]|uniref:hypothetical protein n=1 Tax=Priestia megaterium TaxID=1404 RepID=UPI003D0477AE